MENKAPTNQSNTDINLDQNVAAALAYLLSPITGIVIYVIEKNNRFVRFHAMQSIVFGVAAIAATAIANALVTLLVGVILVPLVSLGIFILWLFLMWKAYNNEEYELPVLGKIARDLLNKSAK